MIKKVLLIWAPLDKEHQPINPGYSVLAPNLALSTLKTKINNTLPEIKIQILDGNFIDLKEIKDIIKNERFDLYGFSNIFTNTTNSLNLAKYAKKINPKSKIVFGNTNASTIAERLNKLNYIDYIVKNDGEIAIIDIIKGLAKTKIIDKQCNINDLLEIDFKDYKKELKAFDSTNKNYDIHTIVPFPMSSIRGCIKAMKCKRCYFCCTQYNNLRVLSPKNFWKMAQNLYYKYNIKYVFETGDDFLIGNYPEELLKAKPKNKLKDFQLRVYADFDSVTEEKVKTLKELNVKIVFLGLENIDKKILKNNNKLYKDIKDWNSYKDFFKKYDWFEKYNIEFCLPILFGLKGETKKTLEKNKKFVIAMLKR